MRRLSSRNSLRKREREREKGVATGNAQPTFSTREEKRKRHNRNVV